MSRGTDKNQESVVSQKLTGRHVEKEVAKCYKNQELHVLPWKHLTVHRVRYLRGSNLPGVQKLGSLTAIDPPIVFCHLNQV